MNAQNLNLKKKKKFLDAKNFEKINFVSKRSCRRFTFRFKGFLTACKSCVVSDLYIKEKIKFSSSHRRTSLRLYTNIFLCSIDVNIVRSE